MDYCGVITLCDVLHSYRVEFGSLVVEYQTCNQNSSGWNPPVAPISKFGHFRSLHDALVQSAV